MHHDMPFHELLAQLRAGDEVAVAWLVRHYEPEIRRLIRVRLRHSDLRRTLDSVDICQSAICSFLKCLGSNQVEVPTPTHLMHLLATMAQNKFRDALRKHQALRRGRGRTLATDPNLLGEVPDPAGDPSKVVADRDLLEAVQEQMTATERQIAEQRAQGHDWKTLAVQLRSTPAALRRRLARLRTRLARLDLARC